MQLQLDAGTAQNGTQCVPASPRLQHTQRTLLASSDPHAGGRQSSRKGLSNMAPAFNSRRVMAPSRCGGRAGQ